MSEDGQMQATPTVDIASWEESAEDLYEQAPCGYLSLWPDGRIAKVNQTFTRWLGYQPRDLVEQRRFADLLNVGGKIYYETHVALLLQMHGSVNEIRLDLVRQDGTILPALVTGRTVRNASGQVAVHRLTIFDNTVRSSYEQELLRARREAEQATAALQQVLTVLPVAVIIVNEHGRIVQTNTHAALFVDTQSAPGDDGFALPGLLMRQQDGTPMPATDQPLNRALMANETVHVQEGWMKSSQSDRLLSVLVSCAPIGESQTSLTGAVIAIQDISKIKEIEQARDMFVMSAAHDIKNPLTVVRSFAQFALRQLQRQVPIPESVLVSYLTRIHVNTDIMLDQINEVLDVMRQSHGEIVPMKRVPLNLVEVVTESIEPLRDASNRDITLQLPYHPLPILGDRARLKRVIGNLLTNALKYSPAGGEIAVTVWHEHEGDHQAAAISVQDHGVGIPAADLPHIFESFKRASNVVGKFEGMGIGLASARGIIEQHSGTITVQSTEGVGSLFIVRLPCTNM